MIKIGLTGSISTGKSRISEYIVLKGIPIVDADKISRDLVQINSPVWRDIKEKFGDEFFLNNGDLNRKKMADYIFSDEDMRKQLNRIMHPKIAQQAEKMLAQLEEQGFRMAIFDAALLWEARMQCLVNYVCVVYCNDRVRIERLINRDQLTYEQALARIKSQMPQEEKLKLADYVIDNSKDWQNTKIQVIKLIDIWENL